MGKVRVSAIGFLNTAPLLRGLLRERPPDVQVGFALPSECADLLRQGGADVGVIPSIEYQRIGGLVVLGDAAIASRERVRSILLLSSRPPDQVRTVAADTSSRTSVALAQIILRLRYRREVEMAPHAPDPRAMLAACDAALVIGDPALRYALDPLPGIAAYDLAAEWKALTGKPFVFAFWAARRPVATPELAELFNRSRDEGVAEIETIVEEESARRRIPRELVHSYLTENIHFFLDAARLEGLREFYRLAQVQGLIPHLEEVEFVKAGAHAAC